LVVTFKFGFQDLWRKEKGKTKDRENSSDAELGDVKKVGGIHLTDMRGRNFFVCFW
jgi:hypothetical protein